MAAPDAELTATAQRLGLVRCVSCGELHSSDEVLRKQAVAQDADCWRCGAALHSRRPLSLQRTWAFLLSGLLAYIPANALPIMTTDSLTYRESDTILSGIIALYDSGSVFVAVVVFVASICIPIIKFVVIGGLAISLHYSWRMPLKIRHHLYSIAEFIGRWSMIDVFVVAVLAALIQLGSVLTITPGWGINAFAASVIFTMLAASSLDPRLIWDEQPHGR